MSKLLSLTFIIIAAIGGIMLGNLYGRRDIANSRPPTVVGELGLPSNIETGSAGYSFKSVPFKNAAGDGIFGAISLLNLGGGRAELEVSVWKLPDQLSDKDFYRLVLFSASREPARELTGFSLSREGTAQVKISLSEISSGQYFVVMPKDSGDLILVSEPVN